MRPGLNTQMWNLTNIRHKVPVFKENNIMKTQDFSALNIGPDDDDFNDPATQDDYPESTGENAESSGTGDEADAEDTDEGLNDPTDTEDINENEEDEGNDRSANDVDGNGGYPDDKGTINPGVI